MARKNDINFDYNSEIKKCKTIDDVLGKNGLVQRLVKDVLENILEAEMNILEETNTNVKVILNLAKEIIEMDIAKKI